MAFSEILELFDRVASRVVKWFMTDRQQILMILYVCYIWDAVRRDYTESRIEKYNEFYRKSTFSQKPQSDKEQELNYLHSGDRQFESTIYFDCNQGTSDWRSKKAQLLHLIDRKFDCPIPSMPKLIRTYQIFSTVFLYYSFVKYALVSSIRFRWIDVEQTYACYLPGRLGLVVEISDDMPWFSFILCGFHVIWRLMWHFCDRLELDCFIFLYHDEETILDKQFRLPELNDPKVAPEIAYGRYLCNETFFQPKVDSRGHTLYKIRQHRTIEHHKTLIKSIYRVFFLFWNYLLFPFTPLYIFGIYTQTTAEYFKRNYPGCESFSSHYKGEANFTWSINDNFRLSYLFFDLFDNLIISVDTVLTMIFPVGAGIIITQELNSRFDTVCGKLCELNDEWWYFSTKEHEVISPMTMMFIEQLEQDSDTIFYEIISTFQYVRTLDEFVRRVAIFALYGWFVIELSIQFIILYGHSSDPATHTYYMYIQVLALISFWSFFLVMSRPYNRTRILYSRLCSAMALSPHISRTKLSWLWLLEYYHKGFDRCTLHMMGKSFPLTNLNFLRCISWAVTCILIVLNSRKQKHP